MSSSGTSYHLKPIERIDNPSLELMQTFRERRLPVVITGATGNWTALTNWNADYLDEKVGDSPVPVFKAIDDGPAGRFFFENTPDTVTVKLREAVKLLRGERPRIYMAGIPMSYYLPSLLDEIPLPEIIPDARPAKTQMWISGGDSIGPLHYDGDDNIHAVIMGRKRFRMFDYDQSRFLYTNPLFSQFPHYSRVSPHAPDLDRFPKFEEASGYDVTLEAGDLIYIPTGCWHQVETVEPSIAINYWLGRKFLRTSNLRLYPAAITTLCLALMRAPFHLLRKRQ